METNTFRSILDEPIPKFPKLKKPLAPVPSHEKQLEQLASRIRKQKRRYEELQEELFNLKKAKLEVEENITIEHKDSLEGQINEFVYKKNGGDTQELFNKFYVDATKKHLRVD